jgi:acetoin:2,6-dichlorophenolindophenol oxidoreductase subunit beta
MAELTYRDAVIRGIAQEMTRDPDVVFLGEDIAKAGGSVENWCMMIPGLKVVAPSTPVDVIGLLAASVRDPNPVIFLEHKSLYATKGEVPDGEIVDTLGTAKIVRPGKDATILALALMVPRALAAADKLKSEPASMSR